MTRKPCPRRPRKKGCERWTNLASAAQELCRCIREVVTGPRRFAALEACEKALVERSEDREGKA